MDRMTVNDTVFILSAAAAVVAKGVATQPIERAFYRAMSLLERRFDGQAEATKTLEEFKKNPASWGEPLKVLLQTLSRAEYQELLEPTRILEDELTDDVIPFPDIEPWFEEVYVEGDDDFAGSRFRRVYLRRDRGSPRTDPITGPGSHARPGVPTSGWLSALKGRIDRVRRSRSAAPAPPSPTYGVPAELEGNGAVVAPPVTCHFRAEMDNEVLVHRVTTVEVNVSREVIGRVTDAAADEQSAEVDPHRRLIIQLLPKANVEVVGESRADIPLPDPGQPQSLYFDIRPMDLGGAEVWVVVRQGQVPLTTLKLAAEVVRSISRASGRRSSESVASEAEPLSKPLHQLRIYQLERGGRTFYSYELEAPALDILGYWESQTITGDVGDYVSSLYTRIEERWLSSNRDVEEFTEELREFGVELLEELVPQQLQQILWDNRERFESIQVLGDEPFIPWELVHLKAPGQAFPDETCFLGQIGLVRWLYDGGWPPDQMLIRPGRARYVIPDYPDERFTLPETIAERAFLETTFGATAVEPQPNPVRDVLSTPGSFDLLHFAAHGVADSDNIDGAQIVLEGRRENGEYVPAFLTSTTAETRSNLKAPDGSRPMVVLNACKAGRAGYRLTGIGGFAQAFLKGQAGAFIGTLWSVGDAPARIFTETFYTQLLAGKNVSEGAVVAREQARADGDATWLAYVVYAHPHATLTRSSDVQDGV